MSITLPRPALALPRVGLRAVLAATVILSLAAGFMATGSDASVQAERAAGPELAHLLQMMAALKLALAAGAALLVDWRIRQPIGPRATGAYLAAMALISAGPGLVWGLAHVALGAVVLHSGLLMLIVLACRDEGMRPGVLRRTSEIR